MGRRSEDSKRIAMKSKIIRASSFKSDRKFELKRL
jgi:hypothetical protein